MSTQNNQTSMGLPGWLTLLFVALKLTGQINWPWLWVLSPIWISILLFLIFFIIAFIILSLQK